MINLTVLFLTFTTSHAVMTSSAQLKRKECFYQSIPHKEYRAQHGITNSPNYISSGVFSKVLQPEMHSGVSSCDPNLFYAYSVPLSDLILDFFLSISHSNTELGFLKGSPFSTIKIWLQKCLHLQHVFADDGSNGPLKKGAD